MQRPDKQTGVALITVLLVFFLVTLIATEIVNRVHFSIRHTGNQLIAAQAYQYALGGEAFARQILYRDFETDQKEGTIDHLGEKWANLSESYDFDQGVIEIHIRDLQGRLNINNLASSKGEVKAQSIEPFQRLLSNLSLEPGMLEAWLDWMDQDITPRGQGAEDEDYLALDRPYRTANQSVAHTSELLMTKGMQWSSYEKLLPNLVALPETTAVNVNTASLEVLQAIISEVDEAAAERIIAGREELGYESLESLLAHESMVGLTINEGDLTVQTEYFEVTVRSEFAGREVWLTSILYRNAENGEIRLLSRDRRRQFEEPKDEKPEVS